MRDAMIAAIAVLGGALAGGWAGFWYGRWYELVLKRENGSANKQVEDKQ